MISYNLIITSFLPIPILSLLQFFVRNVAKMKLQYFGYLIRRVDSFVKTLMLGGMRARGKGGDRG